MSWLRSRARGLATRSRRASAGAAGSVVGILDEFLPSDLSGLIIWVRADSITGKVDGNTITTWSDESGQGTDVTQATAAKKPVYKTDIINGLPVIRFDGVDDVLNSGAFSSELAQPNTICIVFKHLTGSVSSNERIVNGYDSSLASSHLFHIVNTSPDAFTVSAGINIAVAASNADFHILITIYNTTSSLIHFDGGEQVANAGTKLWNEISLGSARFGTEFANVDIAEIIGYNRNLSSNQAAKVENYLSRKYAITLG